MAIVSTLPASLEVELHEAQLERMDDLEIENLCLRSGWLSVMRRIQASETRRLRWTLAALISGFLLAVVADGTLAQNLDRLLNWIGI